MDMTLYSMSIDDMTENANTVKECLLFTLEREGLLKKPATEIAEEYAIVCSKPGWFGTLWKKLKPNEDTKKNVRYDVVKSV
jgi:hypothetical protein